jgi:filamentous hemagglutinin
MKLHPGPRSSRLVSSLLLSLFLAAVPLGAAHAGRCTARTDDEKAAKIAAHAFDKHRDEFEARRKIAGKAYPGPAIDSEAALASKVKEILDAGEGERVSGSRVKYWQESTGTIVIFNPRAADCGTVFRPNRGKAYYDAQR